LFESRAEHIFHKLATRIVMNTCWFVVWCSSRHEDLCPEYHNGHLFFFKN